MKAVGCSLVLAAVVLLGGQAQAQKVVRAPVAEDFAPSVKVSGDILVGVVIGSLAGAADPRKLVVTSTPGTAGMPVCFNAKTRDGQYAADAHLPRQVVPGEDFILQPEDNWKHLNALSSYSFQDFATLVRVGNDCALNRKALIVPVRYPSAGARELTVFVNSARSLSATVSLVLADGQALTGKCDKAETAKIRSTAFDMVCKVALPAAARGEAELAISRRARMGNAKDTFRVALPDAAPGTGN
jgi:hypothetical protein